MSKTKNELTASTEKIEKKINVIQKVRLLFYGGAKVPRDNSAFYFAAKNVEKDYRQKFPNDSYINLFVDSSKTIIDFINIQKKSTIASLDLFFHGSKWGLYMYKGSSMNKELSKEEVSSKNLNASLYAGKTHDLLSSTDGHPEKSTIYDIQFDRFIQKGSVIEIHGCESGEDLPIIDCISKNLSEELPEGYIIGHTTKANPNINGDKKTSNQQQDYRHGKRAIWQNGKVLAYTTQKRWLNIEKIIKK